MTQASLDFARVERGDAAEEQRAQLDRVSNALAPRIVQWLYRLEIAAARARASWESWETSRARFLASELHEAVGGAPASADRVLRDLRRRGVVGYEVIDRASSLYRLEWVRPERLTSVRKTKAAALEERVHRLRERLAEAEAALRAAKGEAA